MEKRIALRPYLESIEGHCRNLAREELVDLILNLAKEVPSGGRIEFIDRISELSGKGVRVSRSEDLLQKIEALKEEIVEAGRSAGPTGEATPPFSWRRSWPPWCGIASTRRTRFEP